jgi:hypothetical protein
MIWEIREMMLRSTKEVVNKKKKDRGKPARVVGNMRSNKKKSEEQEDSSRRKFGIQEDFNRAGKLMRRSS